MSFESLTDQKNTELIQMPKRVTNAKAREIQDANHLRRDYKVESEDGKEDFVLFTRQNKTVNDDFSCGLRWIAPGAEELMPAAIQRS
jgi:hypothetical protein